MPTVAGARLFEAGRGILQTCNAVKGELKTIATQKLLRIGVLQSLSSRRFQVCWVISGAPTPHAAIAVVDRPNEQLIELLAERELAAVLTNFEGGGLEFRESGSLQGTIRVGRSKRPSFRAAPKRAVSRA